jgi:hypothetical protein
MRFLVFFLNLDDMFQEGKHHHCRHRHLKKLIRILCPRFCEGVRLMKIFFWEEMSEECVSSIRVELLGCVGPKLEEVGQIWGVFVKNSNILYLFVYFRTYSSTKYVGRNCPNISTPSWWQVCQDEIWKWYGDSTCTSVSFNISLMFCKVG